MKLMCGLSLILSAAIGTAGCTSSGTPGSSTSRKRVFVTSTTYAPNFGPAGADMLCQTAADGGALGATFKAWISSSLGDAIDRISDVGPWYLVDRTTEMYVNRANLLTTPLAKFTQDELGQTPQWFGTGALVWIGSNPNGRVDQTCSNWVGSGQGTVADIEPDGTWLPSGPYMCNSTGALLCVEQ